MARNSLRSDRDRPVISSPRPPWLHLPGQPRLTAPLLTAPLLAAPLLAALLLASGGPLCTVSAQATPRPGFAAKAVFASSAQPYGFQGFAVGRHPGEIYYALAGVLYRIDAPGGTPQVIRALPPGQGFASLHRPAHGRELFYIEFNTGVLHRRDLDTGRETVGQVPANTFDLETTASGAVLVSANPRWPTPGSNNGIWLLGGAAGGGAREVIQVTGPSGPLLIDGTTDDLFYAVQSDAFPTPAGSVRILRFPGARLRAALTGGPVLTEADATVVASGLDGAFDLARDDRGVLYVSDPASGTIHSVDTLGSGAAGVVLGASAGWSSLGLAWFDADASVPPARRAARFLPWQPHAGGSLFVGRSDYATGHVVDRIHPQPPELTLPAGNPVPPAAFDVGLSGLPTHAHGQLLLSPLPAVAPRVLFWQPGDVPLFAELDFAIPAWSFAFQADSRGTATVTLPYRGGVSWQLAAQAVALLPSGELVSSDLLLIQLLP